MAQEWILQMRVISNFMVNTIMGNPLVIYGDGSQTRSFCYVDDMIEALIKSILTLIHQ